MGTYPIFDRKTRQRVDASENAENGVRPHFGPQFSVSAP
jgi:hypothetical protein